ncbi:uncharacterized protein STEHIDRAFT_153546 [Stereum hirsutum FP-91666 SS1]|uniref:uncharacterized protein n=1 Tax=Stereum hirsutum (strain FP-91666) TaxID=721885 RepID=UPI000440DD80|nr:uncharacterized protein STEHIDRAFT_153546 [Stereum hirsutum FP-91666 SS1]EIM89702.1 hypothetical protein STEHIDRAFT_153546 [Stereum hirsutum FP-91666 SS1]
MAPRALFFYGLNAIRFLSVVALILVFASSIFVMVTDVRAVNEFEAAGSESDSANCDYIEDSTVPNQPAGVFWAVVNRLFIIFQVIFLFLSEVSWPMPFFDRFFPVLGSNFGLGPLGIFQGLIGATILSHHCDDFTLVAAFFLFALGCVNMLLGLIFRESAKSKRSIRAWRSGSASVLPVQAQMTGTTAVTSHYTGSGANGNGNKGARSTFRQSLFGGRKADPLEFGEKGSMDKSSFGFGRQGEKKAGLKGFLLTRPLESLPRYTTDTHTSTDEPPRASSPVSMPRPTGAPMFRSSPTAL